jgi:hypothetical protein
MGSSGHIKELLVPRGVEVWGLGWAAHLCIMPSVHGFSTDLMKTPRSSREQIGVVSCSISLFNKFTGLDSRTLCIGTQHTELCFIFPHMLGQNSRLTGRAYWTAKVRKLTINYIFLWREGDGQVFKGIRSKHISSIMAFDFLPESIFV